MRRTLLLLLTVPTLLAPAGAAAADLGTRPLERGDRGGDVRRLQTLLAKLRVQRVARDGVFGARTAAAVRRYERRSHVAVDGTVSTGQARGMLRRAGWRVPAPVLPRSGVAPAPTPATPAPGAVFPVGGPVTWGDGFGDRGGAHEGVDLLAACGTPVLAITAGRVSARATGGAAGRWLALTDADGHEWLAMHLSAVDVHTGDAVVAGQRLGLVGRTGNATACHLHAELRPSPGRAGGARPVDPEPVLRSLVPPR